MTDILNQLEVTVECEQCGTFTTSGGVIAESQRLVEEGFPGSPYECPLELFAGLLDRAALESFVHAWNTVQRNAQHRGERVRPNGPLPSVGRPEDRAALESLADAWKALERNAQRRGEHVWFNGPLPSDVHPEDHRRLACWDDDGGIAVQPRPGTTSTSQLDSKTRETNLERWDDASKKVLNAHLESDNHDYVWARLPFLVPMAAKIARTCGGGASECARLAGLVDRLHSVVLRHLDREERMLARMTTQGDDTFIMEQLASLRDEHDGIWRLLRQVCDTAELPAIPDAEACPTVYAFHEELRLIERHLRTQMRIEDDILNTRLPAAAP